MAGPYQIRNNRVKFSVLVNLYCSVYRDVKFYYLLIFKIKFAFTHFSLSCSAISHFPGNLGESKKKARFSVPAQNSGTLLYGQWGRASQNLKLDGIKPKILKISSHPFR